ncbi:hypothetical protein ACS7SF_17140 [Ralstonia sp. 25C]|uniref:hypothetical protein n=1 Tax=Ralstonia sp. 25C TaxID=3447363 RepID=UPI003F74FE24
MSRYLEHDGRLCLGSYREYPFDVPERELRVGRMSRSAKQMVALEAIGLVTSINMEPASTQQSRNWSGVRRYLLTDAAKPFVRERKYQRPFSSKTAKEADLCWGRQSLVKIVRWEGPIAFGGDEELTVFYTYRIDDLEDWARRPEIQAAFPLVKTAIDRAGLAIWRHPVKLKDLGWRL